MLEIERKFRLSTIPPSETLGEPVLIVQGYLLADAGELRVRRKGDRCYITVKGEGSLSRQEWESEIDPWAFDVLWPQTEGKRIEKIRYRIPRPTSNSHAVITIEFRSLRNLLKIQPLKNQ